MNRRRFLLSTSASLGGLAAGALPLAAHAQAVQDADRAPWRLRLDRGFHLDGPLGRVAIERDANRVRSVEGPAWELEGDGRRGLERPAGAVVGPRGRLYVVDRGKARVLVLGPTGERERELRLDPDLAPHPLDLAVDAAGRVFVSVPSGPGLWRFDPSGHPRELLGGPRHVERPRGVAVGPDGAVHVVDLGRRRVQVLDADGRPLRSYGEELPLEGPEAVEVDAQGRCALADRYAGMLHLFSPEGRCLSSHALRLDGRVAQPRRLAWDRDGGLRVTVERGPWA